MNFGASLGLCERDPQIFFFFLGALGGERPPPGDAWIEPLLQPAAGAQLRIVLLILNASLQALRTTIAATFHYAFSGRFFGKAYFSQSRKTLTAWDLGCLALGVAESAHHIWLLLVARPRGLRKAPLEAKDRRGVADPAGMRGPGTEAKKHINR